MKPDYIAKGGSPLDRKHEGPKQEAVSPPRGTEDMQAMPAPAKDGGLNRNAEQPVVGSNPTGPSKFDRVAYQREYMREYRKRVKLRTLAQEGLGE